MSFLHKLSWPFVEYLWFYISFQCLLFLLLTQCVPALIRISQKQKNVQSWAHELRVVAPYIMSDIRQAESENEIVCELLEYGAEKLIVSKFMRKIIYWSIIQITWIPKIYVWSFLETLDWFFIGFPIDWINSSCTFDFQVSRLCEQILFNF